MKKLLLILMFLPQVINAQIITTIAGTGVAGYNGDGIAATGAQLKFAYGVGVDQHNGDVYIGDFNNNRVRKISKATGIISTVAGNGNLCDSGTVSLSPDGVPATASAIQQPAYVYVDDSSNLYMSCHGGRIRKLKATTGIINTIDSESTPNGDVAMDASGNLYITDGFATLYKRNAISGVTTIIAGNGTPGTSGDGGPATAAQLRYDYGVALDDTGNIYLAEGSSNRIRKITVSTGIINTIAGSGSTGYSGDGYLAITAEMATPMGLAIDKQGNIFIADYGNNAIRKITAATGIITTIAGNGVAGYSGDGMHATASQLNSPTKIALDTNGNVYIADFANSRIRKIGNPVSPIIGASTLCVGAASVFSDTTSGGIWSSSNVSVASVGSTTGLVTAIGVGTCLISYTQSGNTVTSVITVTSIPTIGAITGPSVVCLGSTTVLSDATTGGVWSSSNTSLATVGSTGIVTGVATGSVNISYTETNSCGSTSTYKAVTVNIALPSPGTISGTTGICAGATSTLTESVSGGAWSAANTHAVVSGTGLLGGLTIGTDTINYTVTNACGTATATKIIAVNALPNAGAISGPSSVCATSTVTLADTIAGGAWDASNSNAYVSAGIVTGVTAGTDTISYSVTNSCGTASLAKVITIGALPVAGTISGASIVCEGSHITYAAPATGGTWSANNANAVVSTSGIVYGMATGTDTIVYSVTNSCGTVNTQKTVSVNPLPDAGTIASPATLCVADTTTLTESVTGGTWVSSNNSIAAIGTTGMVTGAYAGIDTISYSVTNSCGNASVSSIITINPLPDADTITGPNSVCPGQIVYLGEGVTDGIWTSSNNSLATVDSAGIVAGISSGALVISYTVTNGCGTKSALQDMLVESAIICNDMVKSISQSEGLAIYPNPNNGAFTMLLSCADNEDMRVSVTNMVGETVQELAAVTNNVTAVQLNVAAGVYFVSVTAISGRYVVKVVVE